MQARLVCSGRNLPRTVLAVCEPLHHIAHGLLGRNASVVEKHRMRFVGQRQNKTCGRRAAVRAGDHYTFRHFGRDERDGVEQMQSARSGHINRQKLRW